MQITDVRIRKVEKEGKMKAVVSITIDEEFVVHDIKVIEGEKGLNFITTGHIKGREPGGSQIMPNRLYHGYTIRTLVHSHPVSKEASDDDTMYKDQVNSVLKSQGLHIPTYKIYFVGNKDKAAKPQYITY